MPLRARRGWPGSAVRYAEAEPLMIAADAGLKPVGGIEGRDANRARLAILQRRFTSAGSR
jgi:hypothetical protein